MPTVCEALEETGLRNRPSAAWNEAFLIYLFTFLRPSVQVDVFSSTVFSLQMWTQLYTVNNALGSAGSSGGQKWSRMSWILKTEKDFDGKKWAEEERIYLKKKKKAYYMYPGPVTVLDLLYSNSMPGLLEQNRQERSINKCKYSVNCTTSC